MSTVLAIARKELRTAFLSPIALIFVATFLLAAHFSFFWVEGFFARNMADIRPLFQWLPVLLIFLVPALGMRLWSEEERTGTMELLRTLPLRTTPMVLGKFASGLALVAVALALTLPLAFTVELLGDLDWGPVAGGYLATLLLAGAYLAITLCVSATTPSQLVALVFSALACGALYAVGAEPVAALFGNVAGEVLRDLGAGSRFDSILRGVVDLRDLLYYASLITLFLLINVLILERRRWSQAVARARHRRNAVGTAVLVALNLAALNVLVAPVRGARLDLTAQHEYSVSPVTRELLANLREPLLIRGYFSKKTHPLLAPLVPRIRDLIEEYGAIGGDRVRAEVVDPTQDPELEKEANQAYGIKSVPFQFADRHQASVVNSYFHVLIKLGDQYQTLSFDDLIEVQLHGMEIDVRLRNLEYDLTRAVQKVRYGFQSLESVLARLPAKARFTVFVTRAALPEGFEEVLPHVEAAAKELEARGQGRFEWRIVDPDVEGSPLNREQIAQQYGLRPTPLSLFDDRTFMLDLLLEVGEHRERIVPADAMSQADIQKELEAALKRAAPGALKTIGLVHGGSMTFNTLREVLAQTYQVEDVDLSPGRVPGHIDMLLLLDPRGLDETQVYAVDQFLMRGGSAVVATGGRALDPESRTSLRLDKADSGLDAWLAHMGAKVGQDVVLDTQSAAFPIPVTRNIGGFAVEEIQMLSYPAFVDVRPEGMARDNPAVAGLPALVLHWASPVEPVEAAAGRPGAPPGAALVRSSPQSWLVDDFQAEPDFDRYPDLGWPLRQPQQSYPLALALTGPFSSYFKGREAPVLGGDKEAAEAAADPAAAPQSAEGKGRRGSVVEGSPDASRLVVLGTASFVSDFVVDLGRHFSDAFLVNLQLLQNLADWCQEDEALLSIRARGGYARTLEPTSLGDRKLYEWGNYLLALLAVGALGLASLNRRRNARPMALEPRQAAAAGGAREGKERAA